MKWSVTWRGDLRGGGVSRRGCQVEGTTKNDISLKIQSFNHSSTGIILIVNEYVSTHCAID